VAANALRRSVQLGYPGRAVPAVRVRGGATGQAWDRGPRLRRRARRDTQGSGEKQRSFMTTPSETVCLVRGAAARSGLRAGS
jgi:hypothetical protein